MTLSNSSEAAIAQPYSAPLSPEVLFFGHQLMLVSRMWRTVVDKRLAELGLTDTTWVPLFHLHAADEALTLKQLAQRVGLDSSTLVRVVDLLESHGLVVRETDASDRRSKSLRLTRQGLAVVADVRGKLHQVEAQVLAGMDAHTVSTLRVGMQQLHERLVCIQSQDKACI